jgi:hypothetical protein
MRDYLWFAQILVDADLEPRDYSGRGMYGKKCLGFVIERNDSPLRAFGGMLASLSSLNGARVKSDLSDLSELMLEACEDSMGLGTIVYFPKVKWDDAYTDPHNASEDEEDDAEQTEWEDSRSDNLLERTTEPHAMEAWEKDEQEQAQALQDDREQVDMVPKA